MRALLKRLSTDRRGATALEYGLIVAIISLVVFAGVNVVFKNVGVKYNTVNNTLSN